MSPVILDNTIRRHHSSVTVKRCDTFCHSEILSIKFCDFLELGRPRTSLWLSCSYNTFYRDDLLLLIVAWRPFLSCSRTNKQCILQSCAKNIEAYLVHFGLATSLVSLVSFDPNIYDRNSYTDKMKFVVPSRTSTVWIRKFDFDFVSKDLDSHFI